MNLYEILKKLNIEYNEIEHEPVFTVGQAQAVKDKIDGVGCKNLFLTDKKGKYVLAKRELNEETGAIDFDIKPICAYSVTVPNNFEGQETFGMLYYADIKSFDNKCGKRTY